MYTFNGTIVNTTEDGLLLVVPGEPIGSSIKIQQEVRVRPDRLDLPEPGSSAAHHLDLYLSSFQDQAVLVTLNGEKDRSGALIAEVSLVDTLAYPFDPLNISDRLVSLGYAAYSREGELPV